VVQALKPSTCPVPTVRALSDEGWPWAMIESPSNYRVFAPHNRGGNARELARCSYSHSLLQL
jgi:hypothetical protein